MSLQDKINSAKPTTFLTDGLSEDEVKQEVEEGRKRIMEYENISLGEAIEEDRCCFCGGVKRFGICQDCGSDM